MATVFESMANQSQMNAELSEGLTTLSLNQTITFNKYIRVVLPLDGFIFWVRADLLSNAAIQTALGIPLDIETPSAPVVVRGALQYSVQEHQTEDEVIAVSHVLFTTTTEIQDMNAVYSNVMWIGDFDIPPEPPFLGENPTNRQLRFAFSGLTAYFAAAGLFHYRGNALYPAMTTQIIDTLDTFDISNVVVSNSLPVWLAMAQAAPNAWQPTRQIFPVYPSFCAPDNLEPPYATVHIEPSQTRAIASAPYIDDYGSHYQLVVDRVRITFYGLRNAAVLDFMDAVNQYSLDSDLIGVMNLPTVQDDKRTQVELGILAMKKTAEFEVSYYQSRVNTFALQYILSCIPTFYVGALVAH